MQSHGFTERRRQLNPAETLRQSESQAGPLVFLTKNKVFPLPFLFSLSAEAPPGGRGNPPCVKLQSGD